MERLGFKVTSSGARVFSPGWELVIFFLGIKLMRNYFGFYDGISGR